MARVTFHNMLIYYGRSF